MQRRACTCLLLAILIPSALPREAAAQASDIVIRDYRDGLSGVRAANPAVKLRVERDSTQGDEPVLIVDYPAPSGEPAARDVRCDAVNRNWSSGRAIAFRIKPSQAMKLSVSFFDRNRVVYTAWTDLKADIWQPVRISFDEIKPNPYFQPPDAKRGAPIDVSDVGFIAFAPQDETSGSFAISTFTVIK